MSRETEFNIDLNFTQPDVPPEIQQVFMDAAAQWEQVIVGDITGTQITNEVAVDDLFINIEFGAIDGPGGSAALTEVNFVNSASGLPAVSSMIFEPADLTGSNIGETVLYAMGQALGLSNSDMTNANSVVGALADMGYGLNPSLLATTTPTSVT
jgi:hypothetical protein